MQNFQTRPLSVLCEQNTCFNHIKGYVDNSGYKPVLIREEARLEKDEAHRVSGQNVFIFQQNRKGVVKAMNGILKIQLNLILELFSGVGENMDELSFSVVGKNMKIINSKFVRR